jgi:hypothetical protein
VNLRMKSQLHYSQKGVNKTVNERLQTKWLNGQIKVRMCEDSCKL